jgi:hypothetical protein
VQPNRMLAVRLHGSMGNLPAEMDRFCSNFVEKAPVWRR